MHMADKLCEIALPLNASGQRRPSKKKEFFFRNFTICFLTQLPITTIYFFAHSLQLVVADTPNLSRFWLSLFLLFNCDKITGQTANNTEKVSFFSSQL